MSLFQLDAVSRTYPGGVRALDQVSLAIAAGTQLGIVGESGSGKTTLIRLLAALDRPTSGQVLVDGAPITSRAHRRELRSRVQLVFQDPRSSLNPRMKILDLVTEPLRAPGRRHTRAERRVRFEEVMTQVGLDPTMAGRYPHEFSGGQRQRIAIARALAPRPRVLIADEPVSALDVSVRAQILNTLNELVSAEDLTLIMVSHDLAVVRHLCEQVVVLLGGRVVEHGPTTDVFANPDQDYTRELLAAVPRLPAVRGQ